jgi:5-methylcytosine-specific restriction endonuclease McrA
MPFRKGVPHTPEEKEKATKHRRAINGTWICMVCKEPYLAYVANQNICQKPSCRTTYRSNYYRQRRISDPIGALAYRLSGSLRMGKGKAQAMRKLLTEAMGKLCEYCEITTITIENASVDHKTPRSFQKVWDFRTRKMVYTKDEIIELDRPSNLHIVCRDCNQLKSDLTHEQFIVFMAFLKVNPEIEVNLRKRLKAAKMIFSHIGPKRAA